MPSRLMPTRGVHEDGVPPEPPEPTAGGAAAGSTPQVAPLTPAQHSHVPFMQVPYTHAGEQGRGGGTAGGAVAELRGSVPAEAALPRPDRIQAMAAR
jgi:hypothetical protein